MHVIFCVPCMVNQLRAKWAKASWLQRYMYGSFELNMRLIGLASKLDRSQVMWTPGKVKQCMQWMKTHARITEGRSVLYRETSHACVMMERDPDSLTTPKRNRCILSMTSQKNIAREFAWPKGRGFMHRLVLKPGCRVVDMQYAGRKGSREKEVLLLPGHTLVLLKHAARSNEWEVHP